MSSNILKISTTGCDIRDFYVFPAAVLIWTRDLNTISGVEEYHGN